MPDEALKAAEERLDQALADCLDEDAWPLDEDDIFLGWVSVDVLEEPR